ncbi:hypothetical protein TFUB20_01121 [Tannerella forsythia]|uniref:Uncharacterized protein n=1 Tax=Tannerella forsythia TaxID=28112 RepID=A0A1D3UKI4_TANFO|nr:hypothetical protein TFUB20_01121 [Tannerella forsythia]
MDVGVAQITCIISIIQDIQRLFFRKRKVGSIAMIKPETHYEILNIRTALEVLQDTARIYIVIFLTHCIRTYFNHTRYVSFETGSACRIRVDFSIICYPVIISVYAEDRSFCLICRCRYGIFCDTRMGKLA